MTDRPETVNERRQRERAEDRSMGGPAPAWLRMSRAAVETHAAARDMRQWAARRRAGQA